jgi:glycosyltransferase involved in cell wall biosynthesis
MVSDINDVSRSYYQNNGIPYYGIAISLPAVLSRYLKLNSLKNIIRSWKDWRTSLIMAKTLESFSPDIIEFIDIHSNGYAYLKRNPKTARQKKVVIRSHTPWGLLRTTYLADEIKSTDGWWATQREHYCFHNCDAITTPSQDLKQQLIKFYQLPARKITVIPNIVDTDHFKPLNGSRNNQYFNVLHVGRFERAKGAITITKAFIESAKENPKMRLINVGLSQDTTYDKCVQLLKESKMMDRISFNGFVPYKDLPEWYAKADVVIVASNIYESFSYTVAQAMACGKPVIASNIGGIPETVNHGEAGLLFSPGDVVDLSDKIELLYNNTEKRRVLGEKARLFCETNFSIEVLKTRYLEYYQSLLN